MVRHTIQTYVSRIRDFQLHPQTAYINLSRSIPTNSTVRASSIRDSPKQNSPIPARVKQTRRSTCRSPNRAARGDNHATPRGPPAAAATAAAIPEPAAPEPGERGQRGAQRDSPRRRPGRCGSLLLLVADGRQAAPLQGRHEQAPQGCLHNAVARARGRRAQVEAVRPEQRGAGRAAAVGHPQRPVRLRGPDPQEVGSVVWLLSVSIMCFGNALFVVVEGFGDD